MVRALHVKPKMLRLALFQQGGAWPAQSAVAGCSEMSADALYKEDTVHVALWLSSCAATAAEPVHRGMAA